MPRWSLFVGASLLWLASSGGTGIAPPAIADAPPVVDYSWSASGWALAVAPDGSVYVADETGRLVEHFASNGALLGSWSVVPEFQNNPNSPQAIAVDRAGDVYVTILLGSKIWVFNSTGQLIRTIAAISTQMTALAIGPDGACYALGEGVVAVYNSAGQFVRTQGEFLSGYQPQDIALDEAGNLFEAVANTAGIFKFAPDGSFLDEWDHVILHGPGGIVTSSDGNVVVGSQDDGRLVELTSNGLPIWSIALPAPCTPIDIARDRDSGYYVLDVTGQRVLHLSPAAVATRASSWGRVKAGYH